MLYATHYPNTPAVISARSRRLHGTDATTRRRGQHGDIDFISFTDTDFNVPRHVESHRPNFTHARTQHLVVCRQTRTRSVHTIYMGQASDILRLMMFRGWGAIMHTLRVACVALLYGGQPV